jgi:chromosome condensin MukBEF ATPase and DNA-binding subunit MukB
LQVCHAKEEVEIALRLQRLGVLEGQLKLHQDEVKRLRAVKQEQQEAHVKELEAKEQEHIAKVEDLQDALDFWKEQAAARERDASQLQAAWERQTEVGPMNR